MKQFYPLTTPSELHPTVAIRSRTLKLTAVVLATFALSACSSIPEVTQQRVADSETAVRQAQQTIGTSEPGAVELQQARDKLAMAQAALKAGRAQDAERAAVQARLDAELAIAKTQSAAARRSADEVLASLETLRQEAERSSPTQR